MGMIKKQFLKRDKERQSGAKLFLFPSEAKPVYCVTEEPVGCPSNGDCFKSWVQYARLMVYVTITKKWSVKKCQK